MTTAVKSVDATSPQAQEYLREFERQIEQAGQVLLDWGSLSTRGQGAYNAGIRIPGQQAFVLGTFGEAAVVDFDGNVQGELSRSLREVIAVYTAVFKERDDLQAVLHTHSPYLTAHAIAHKPFRIQYWSLAKRAGAEDIPLSEWAPRYAPEPVVQSLRAHPDAPAVLLRNRGLFAWTPHTLLDLAQLLNGLEEGAEIAVYSALLGGGKDLPEGALDTFLKQRKG